MDGEYGELDDEDSNWTVNSSSSNGFGSRRQTRAKGVVGSKKGEGGVKTSAKKKAKGRAARR